MFLLRKLGVVKEKEKPKTATQSLWQGRRIVQKTSGQESEGDTATQEPKDSSTGATIRGMGTRPGSPNDLRQRAQLKGIQQSLKQVSGQPQRRPFNLRTHSQVVKNVEKPQTSDPRVRRIKKDKKNDD